MSSIDGQEEASQARKTHLSPNDYGIIVSWMEKSANYEAIHGSAKKTIIGGTPKVTKLATFPPDSRQHAAAGEHIQAAEAFLREAPGLGVETPSTDTVPSHERAATSRSTTEISAIKIAVRGGSAREKIAVLAKKAKATHSQPHDSRASLSHSYTQNNEARFDFYYRKLEQEDRHWKETQKENERRLVFDMEQRQLERQDRQSTRNQELMLELVKQEKTATEIREYFKLVEDMQ